MTRSQAALLLGLAAARDRRTVGEADVLAWAEDLADVDFQDAREALGRHFRDSTDWLLPAHIRALVKVIRADRRRGQNLPALPGPFESDDDRDARIRRGVAMCRAAIPAPPRAIAAEPATETERIRQAALERARSEPRERRRTDPTAARASFGDAVRQIRSSR